MARPRGTRIIGNAPIYRKPESDVASDTDDSANAITGTAGGTDGGTVIIEPRDFGNSDDPAGRNSEQPKRRGRKPGVKNAAKNSALDISSVELLLFSTHNMLAALSKTPQIAFSKEESHLLAVAIGDVAKHYDFMSKVSAEAIAWTNLVQVAALVYGPRIVAIRAARSKKTHDEDNIFPMRTQNG